jgi:transcription elongation factor Elf1
MPDKGTGYHQVNFKREMAAHNDKQQLQFTVMGTLMNNPNKQAVIEKPTIDWTKKETCPFCLSWQPLSAYLISTKKGIHHGLGKCKACGNGLRLKTLFTLGQGTPEAYAKFITEYPSDAFFKKIKWEKWKNRLKMMGWTKRFWDEYRYLNPKDNEEETPEDLEKWDDYDREETKREFELRQKTYEEPQA